jgi:hypothetical protein
MMGWGILLVPIQKIEMPRIEAPPRVEFDLDGSAQWLKRMAAPFSRKCEFICTLEWSWAPVNQRMESYYLQRARTHWVLWRKRYDDNWGRWEKPIAIARYVWKDYDWHGAAMTLIAQLLAEEARYYSSDPGRFDVNDTGLLSMEELDAGAIAESW